MKLILFTFSIFISSSFGGGSHKGCFEQNKLFIGDFLPFSLTLEQCFEACKSLPICKVCTDNSTMLRSSVIKKKRLKSLSPTLNLAEHALKEAKPNQKILKAAIFL